MKKYFSKILFSFFILSAFFIGGNFAHASVLYSQTDKTATAQTASGQVGYQQTLGTGLTGTLGSITVNVSTQNAMYGINPIVYCYTNSAYTTPCSQSSVIYYCPTNQYGNNDCLNTATNTYQDVTAIGYVNQTFLVFNASYYYVLHVADGTVANTFSFGGSTANNYTGGQCYLSAVGGTACGSLNDVYFILNTTAPYTHIYSITPTNNSTTGTTAVTFGASYYFLNPATSNEYPSLPLYIIARFHRVDAPQADITYSWGGLTFNTATTISATLTFPTNTQWEMLFDVSGNGYYFISPFSNPVTFNVVTNPTIGASGDTTCNITSLAGCIQNAFIYLFIPSTSSLGQFGTLYNIVISKPPFGYIVAINTTLTGVNDTGTSAFTLTSLPILNTYIFTPMRDGISWILWVAFAFILFHRLKNIHL